MKIQTKNNVIVTLQTKGRCKMQRPLRIYKEVPLDQRLSLANSSDPLSLGNGFLTKFIHRQRLEFINCSMPSVQCRVFQGNTMIMRKKNPRRNNLHKRSAEAVPSGFFWSYSTVTDFARFLGWSTSYPLNTVTWYASNCNATVTPKVPNLSSTSGT